MADAIRVLFADVEDVRCEAELTILLARRRVAEELQKAPKAKGTRGIIQPGMDGAGASRRAAPAGAPSLREVVGSQKRGLRLKQLASVSRDELVRAVGAIYGQGKEATTSGVLLAGEASVQRRQERHSCCVGSNARRGSRQCTARINAHSTP